MPCHYCQREVYTDYPGFGWGFDTDDSDLMFIFHLECFQFEHDVAIA